MAQRNRRFFGWCPAPEPTNFRTLRQYSRPILALITMATLIFSVAAASYAAFSSTAAVAAPLVSQPQLSTQTPAADTNTSEANTPTPTHSSSVSVVGEQTSEGPTNTQPQTNATQSKYTISGYILDSNGNGIANADIIFNVPDIVPGVFSDSSGYYRIIAPAGTYNVNVWPPFDSNYIDFDQRGFVVNSDMTKNITLTVGYKVSGYVMDSVGDPVNGAAVVLNNFYCGGYYSTSTGYYYVTVPSGTYTLTAKPKDGVSFNIYTETSFTVTSDNSEKNIYLSNQARYRVSGYVRNTNGNGLYNAEVIFGVPDIIPAVFTNSAGYYEAYAPRGTYTMNVWPPFDSNYQSYQLAVTVAGVQTRDFTLSTGYKLSGYITDSQGNPVFGALVLLDNLIVGWYSRDNGYYFDTAPAGTYTLTVVPRTGENFTTYVETNFVFNGNTVKNITVVNGT
jgi:protocatechuate 3,4-dioxygenase beta subunit